jgi:hypothetical protein
MSGIQRMQTVRVGKQSTTDVSTTAPGTLVFLQPESVEGVGADTTRIERNLMRGDNMEYASVRGPKSLDAIAITHLLKGVSGNTGTAAFASLTTTEDGHMWESIFGAAVSDPSGVGNTATAGAGGANTLTMTAGTNYDDGRGVLFTTSTGTWAREIVSGGTTADLVLDRVTTGVLTNPTTILRGAKSVLASSTSMHTALYIDVEGEWGRRTFGGCYSSMDLNFTEGQAVKVSTSWMPTDWAAPAKANPSFSAATAGGEIVNVGSTFWIGDSAFLLKGAKLSLGYTIVPRTTIAGANGVHGYVITRKAPVLTGTLYVGSNASFGELADLSGTPTLQSLQALDADPGEVPTTRDIALQVGTQGTAAIYCRIPAAEFTGTFGQENGADVFSFSARATRPASGSMLRLHRY